jgi:serine/threonine-protein kinase
MKFPAQPDSWIGRSVGDRQRYRLDKCIGSGGMGDVFVAMDTLLGQQVALKLLKDTLVESTSLRKRFEREVAVCAALKSDHIVTVSDYGVTDEGHPFYVMEYLRGQSLGELLRQQQQLDVERTVSIITQVCEGLRKAHEGVTLWQKGASVSEHVKVVHRDLKPDNIFLVPTALGELVKILDFGIAKIRDHSVEQTNLTLAFIGTFRYAAPEQLIVAKNLDERADVYSLGIILYEMLSGTDPFGFGMNVHKATGMSWAVAHKSKPPVPLRLQPGLSHLSPALEAVVMRCLEKEPNQRFVSVEQLNRALQVAARSGQSDRELNATTQAVSDVTIFQTPPPGQGYDNTTPNKPLKPPRQEVPDAMIADTLPPLRRASNENQISQDRTPSSEIANASSTQVPIPSEQRSRRIPKHLFFLGAIMGIGLAAIAAVYAYTQLQPANQTQLDEIRTLQTEGRYEDCIAKAEIVDRDSTLHDDAQRLINECRVEYAKQLAASDNFTNAIALAKKIPKNSPLYPQAQALIKEWSEI